MNIILTGAAGGIGSTLAYKLYKDGNHLTLIDNFRNGYKENLIINGEIFGEFIESDICDKSLLSKLLNRKQYDCIIHLAAITALPDCESNPEETIQINVIGTMNMLECARKLNIPHIIFASTNAIYENNTEAVFTEKLQTSPRLWYSLSKKMAEDICQSYRINYNMNITILRFFNVFGPRQDLYRKNPPLINYIVREFISGRQPILHSTGTQQRDYIHVDDVNKLIKKCLIIKPNDTFNVCTGETLSVKEIVKYVQDALNTNIEPIYRDAVKLWDSYPILFKSPYPLLEKVVIHETNKYSKGCNNKAKNYLDWEPNTNLKKLLETVSLEIRELYLI
jgi:nucleoside-diphosphate-sugar epimerase